MTWVIQLIFPHNLKNNTIHNAHHHILTILTTNLAAVVWMCVSVQNLTNFCPHALISNPNVPKILFA